MATIVAAFDTPYTEVAHPSARHVRATKDERNSSTRALSWRTKRQQQQDKKRPMRQKQKEGGGRQPQLACNGVSCLTPSMVVCSMKLRRTAGDIDSIAAGPSWEATFTMLEGNRQEAAWKLNVRFVALGSTFLFCPGPRASLTVRSC